MKKSIKIFVSVLIPIFYLLLSKFTIKYIFSVPKNQDLENLFVILIAFLYATCSLMVYDLIKKV